jgi:hypothetical protein
MQDHVDELAEVEQTLDLAELARIERGDRVKVEEIPDATQELFDKTLVLVRPAEGADEGEAEARAPREERQFVPENKDLRNIYFLAEAVGGYEIFNDLVNVHSPGSIISQSLGDKAKAASLSEEEVRKLGSYQVKIDEALKNANEYLRNTAIYELEQEDLHELHDVMLAARQRAKLLHEIMGAHLIHEVERVVERLHEYHSMMRKVERTVGGIFVVDSELLFIPAEELTRCVNVLFSAVGNSYLAKNIDGVLLLAARNLLIEVMSFFSYYGKHQIYTLFQRSGTTISSQAIARRIRYEIRQLFEACSKDNKLVLTRVMKDAEREFELSVVAIQKEAEQIAVEAVKVLIPQETAPPPEAKKGLLQRLLAWFRR